MTTVLPSLLPSSDKIERLLAAAEIEFNKKAGSVKAEDKIALHMNAKVQLTQALAPAPTYAPRARVPA